MKNQRTTSLAILMHSRILLIALIILLLSSNAKAQSNNELHKFNRNSDKALSTSEAEITEVRSLFYELQPSLYYGSPSSDKSKDAQVVGFVNTENFSSLYASNQINKSIKMLVIDFNYNEIQSPLDISAIKNFDSLRYIVVRCSESCTSAQISRLLVDDSNRNLQLYYIIDIAE